MSIYGAYRNLDDSTEASTHSNVNSSESPSVSGAAPAEISMAANVAAVAAKIGITRVVQDDRAPPDEPVLGAGMGRRFCGGGVDESSRIVNNVDSLSILVNRGEGSMPENPQQRASSGYSGGWGSSVQQSSGPRMSTPVVGDSTVRGGNEDRGLERDTSVGSGGAQSSMLSTGHDGIAFGTQGGYDESAPFDSSQCLLTQALLGEDSGEEGMWGSGNDGTSLAPYSG